MNGYQDQEGLQEKSMLLNYKDQVAGPKHRVYYVQHQLDSMT